MAPEQIKGKPSAASDIWALGVIAYEMLTGRQPFLVPCDDEGNVLVRELYEMQQAGVQLKPKELRPDLPEVAQSAILKSLSFDPQKRYAQARDFGEALALALAPELKSSPSLAPTDVVMPPTEIIAPEGRPIITSEPVIRVRPPDAEVVISYDSHDLRHAQQLAEQLRAAGISCRMADHAHEAISNDRSATMQAIKQCRLILLICSDAALRSRSIKQELQSAWSCERSFLPLLVEPLSFPEQSLTGSKANPASLCRLPQMLRPLPSGCRRCCAP